MKTIEIAMGIFLCVIVVCGGLIVWKLRKEEREEVEELKRHLGNKK